MARYGLIAIAVLVALHGAAQTVTLGWNPSPTPGVSYRLYAGTNGVSTSSALLKVDCGTNLQATIDRPRQGEWHFIATAYTTDTNGVTMESDPSNTLILRVPAPPAALATLAVQWVGTLASTNWQDMGYFRLKLER